MAGPSPPTVTVVLSDLVGSTALGERLDAEALREVLARYFEEMRDAIERHGGRIEKLIGDAVVAVFAGGPVADDARAAVRAAWAAGDALASLNGELERGWGVRLANRTGVGTGPLEIGGDVEDSRVLSGVAIETAEALERAAPPTRVLVSARTRELVGDAADFAPFSKPPDAGAHLLVGLRDAGEVLAAPAPRRAAAARETRRTVTIVFADGRLDHGDGPRPAPEVRTEAMTRWFAAARGILAGHGGTVEKFIGDAVMAVFGLPRRNEDDALRACRAADGLRRAAVELDAELRADLGVGMSVRVGVNTGRVVAGDASLGQRLATGDAVNLAARLEAAAAPGEVVIGESTRVLVAASVVTERLPLFSLKGKSAPVMGSRLVSVAAAGRAGAREGGAFVGRAEETAVLRALLDVARAGTGRSASILGEAGAGKTRLAEEFLAASADGATVLRGRCLSYGEGITFWPVVEIVRGAAGIAPEDPPERALALLQAAAAGAGADVAERVAAVCGLSDAPFQVGELFWAISELLATLARERPVVVMVEDVHWAEETLLELLEHLEDALANAAVLLVTTARPELLVRRPDWAGGGARAALELGPLSREESVRVASALLGDAGLSPAARARVVAGAAGNPLFLEQLTAMLVESGALVRRGGRWDLSHDAAADATPPSIEALIAARIDELPAPERGVVEPASVIGAEFSTAAVAALVPAEAADDVPRGLGALVAHRLVGRVADADAVWDHRFVNGMIRDVVYDGLLKRARAELHERLVEWGEATGAIRAGSVEGEELAGYHLETAHRYLAELGRLDDHAVELGRRAAARLGPAGARALGRGDMPAAASLLARAARALPDDDAEVPRLLLQAGEAQMEAGLLEDAAASLQDAERRAAARGDAATAAAAHVEHVRMQYTTGAREDDDSVAAEAEAARAAAEEAGDHLGLARAWRLRAYVDLTRSQWGAAEAAAVEMIAAARAAGDRLMATRVLPALAAFVLCGPTPADVGIPRCEEILADVAGDRRAEALVQRNLAHLRAMRGDVATAREGYRRSRAVLEELGWRMDAALVSLDSGPAELLAGDPVAAEAELRGDVNALWGMGERNYVATTAALLAEALYRQGRLDEAAEQARVSRETAGEGDVATQVLWRAVEGKVLARRGQGAAGVALCREALDLIAETDDINTHADVLCDLAEALRLADRDGEWRAPMREALGLYRLKGNLAAERAVATALAGGPG